MANMFRKQVERRTRGRMKAVTATTSDVFALRWWGYGLQREKPPVYGRCA